MSYLTQITFEPALVARLGIRDGYDWHQLVWTFFPGREASKRDFITRLDNKGSCIRLLIISAVEPKCPDGFPAECWQGPRAIPETFFSRATYRFQLCANPTKKIKAFLPDGSQRPNGRREPLRKREDLVAWIRRKGEQNGFVVDETMLQAYPRGREYFEKNGHIGLHSAVEFRGVLKVTEPERFRQAVTSGIGSAKAFGFGLLVIEPLAG